MDKPVDAYRFLALITRQTVISLWLALLINGGTMSLAVAVSESANPTTQDEMAAFFDHFMPQQIADQHIAGAAVAVVQTGQLLFAKGYGYADVVAQKPVVADQTLFHTDSTGKLFVWTALMQLVEHGNVDLDADINRYLDFQIPPTFPQPITLKHLLSHSAGFEDTGAMFTQDADELAPIGLWLLHNLPARVRPPGVVAGYSNYGTALAAYIVERVSGLPFEQYVEERIFQPLGMNQSTLRQPPPAGLVADLTTNYRYANGGFTVVPAIYGRVPAGETNTTVTDMAKFMLAHLQTGDSPIFRAATAQQMHSQLFTHDSRVSGMAYGFAESKQNGQHLLRHEGNLEGVSSSALFLLPAEQIGVYVAYNSNGGFAPGEEFRRAFLDHFFPVVATPPQPIELTVQQIKQLTGSYRSTRMFHTSFAKVIALLGGNYADIQVHHSGDGAFTTQGLGGAPLQWVSIAPQVLRLADGAANSYGDLVFVNDPQNQRVRLFIGNNPYRAYEKVAWYESANLHLLWLAICELVFLLLLIAAPLVWLLRQVRGTPLTTNFYAQWLLAGASLLALFFPISLLLTITDALLYGITQTLLIVLTLPLIAIFLASLFLFFSVRNWRKCRWSERIQMIAFGVTMIAFVGWLNYWNLLGWHL